MQEGLFEEAGLLREREVDMKVRLGGLPHEAPQVPCVTLADVESVLSAWTGIPPERMGQDDRDRLSVMEPSSRQASSSPHLWLACACPCHASDAQLMGVSGSSTWLCCALASDSPAFQGAIGQPYL